MAAKNYTVLDITTVRLTQKAATQVSTGAANAGDIVALGEDGKIDTSLIPSGGAEATDAVVCTEVLSAGDWINLYNNAGTKACRRAIATDTTKPVNGFVTAAYTSGQTAQVSKKGDNTKVALTGFVIADIGKRVFLSATTAGGTTKLCPQAGSLLQPLGSISDVSVSFVTVTVDFGEQIQL